MKNLKDIFTTDEQDLMIELGVRDYIKIQDLPQEIEIPTEILEEKYE